MLHENSEYDESQIKKYKKQIFDKIKSEEWTYANVIGLPPYQNNPNKNFAVQAAKEWAELKLKQLALDKHKQLDWAHIFNKSEDYKLLNRIPFSEKSDEYPISIRTYVGDEIPIVFLDVETTGLSHDTDKLIELGLVKLKYSPSLKVITSIDLVRSEYQDPGVLIPDFITELTGVSNKDTDGKQINVNDVRSWIESDETYVIAHNAKFDRNFFNQLMPSENYSWGCSVSQVDWKKYKEYRIESPKLEYILLKLGYFYEGHRASIDCLAMVQMFITLPEALEDLLVNINKKSYRIEAIKAPFSIKDMLKGAGYRWNGEEKYWWTEVSEEQLQDKLDELDSFSNDYSSKSSNKVELNAKNRFKA
tara:strand:+ start:153 stop:1238 length:1086 start_codon:yes stop_codon:yes gene_type:complete